MAYLKKVEVKDMMRAREDRANAQYSLLHRDGMTAVSFTLNIAGPYKVFPGVSYCFERGLALLKEALRKAGFEAGEAVISDSFTGLEALFSVRGDAREIKRVCAGLDDSLPMGRLFDLDVLHMGPEGFPEKVSREELGFGPRKCLICERPSSDCAAIRRHSAKELALAAAGLILCDFMGSAVKNALIKEVSLTPKPGLVDLNDSGAHRDMDHTSFEMSASAIGPFLYAMAKAGFEQGAEKKDGGLSALAGGIKALGIEAEKAMLGATGGINTHRGAIYSMGIIAASLGAAYAELIEGLESGRTEGFTGAEGPDADASQKNSLDYARDAAPGAKRIAESAQESIRPDAKNGSLKPETIDGTKLKDFMRASLRGKAAGLAKELDALRRVSEISSSHGSLVLEKYGARGIRQEAAEGFPLVFEALSEYERSGSWKTVLLYLMSKTADTTVLYRTGPEGLSYMMKEAERLLEAFESGAGPGEDELDRALSLMNEDFSARGISPGGCADLLSCAMLLKDFEENCLK